MVKRRFLEAKDLPRRVTALLFILITDLAAIVFFYWLFQNIVWSVYSFFYIFAEIICFIHLNFTAGSYAQMRFHRPEPPLEGFAPRVDVFITCSDEDISIIEQTVRAAVEIDYPNKKIYVLDDGKSQQVRYLAEELDCVYITRENRQFTKAGNLNNGLKYANGEFILVLDADQVPRRYIIRRLIGYFIRSNIAFVQSPQTYITPESDPYNSGDTIFNRSVELSKDAQNAVISCGSGVIYRRRCIDIIGGFSTWNLVEDLHTSYKLQQKGFVGIFYNYALTKGIAPPNYSGVARQRHKWAMDTMRIFLWDNPIFKKGLSFIQRINYFDLGLLYIFTGLCMPIYFILPIWSLLTNSYVVISPSSEYMLFRLPYFALTIIMNNFIFRSKNLKKVYQTWNFFFPVFIQGTIDALRNKRLKFSSMVTPKTKPKEEVLPWYATANLQIIILLLYVISLSYAILVYGINKDIFFINALWIVWGTFILLPLSIIVFREQHGYELSRASYFALQRNVIGVLSIVVVALLIYYIVPESFVRSQLFLTKAEREAETLLIEANRAVEAKDIEGAMKSYQSYLRLYPSDITIRKQYANLLHVNRRYNTSAEQYAYLINNSLAEKEDYLQYARVLNWGGRPKDSLKGYETLLAKYPDDRIIKREYEELSIASSVSAPAERKILAEEMPETKIIAKQVSQPEAAAKVVTASVPESFVKEPAPAQMTIEKVAERTLRYNFIPMFSIFWQDTDYRRINEGAEFRVNLPENAESFNIQYYFSHLKNDNSGSLNRDSFRIGYDKDFSNGLSSIFEMGMNSYTESIGETFAAKGKFIYSHQRGNVAFEFSRYDIIDTTDVFIPRYYTLVTNIEAARHKVVTNDFKLESYQSLSEKLAFYGNAVYGKYTDNNIKKNIYLSPIFLVSPELSLKYGFAFIDVRNPSPYYYAHNNSKIHQVRAEYNKQINEKLSFDTEGVLSYDIKKGIGASAFFGLKYRLSKNTRLDLSSLYSYAKDNDANNDINSINFNCALNFEF